jgi:alpha-L-arabinofuranosidase
LGSRRLLEFCSFIGNQYHVRKYESSIELNGGYDIKIEIRGNTINGYLDGKFVKEVADTRANVNNLCISAARDVKSGDIILKVVNVSVEPLKTKIDLKGVEAL